jgi:hypothetical protein
MRALKIKLNKKSGDLKVIEHYWTVGLFTFLLSGAGLFLFHSGRFPETTALLSGLQLAALFALLVLGVSLLSNRIQISLNDVNFHITKESSYESWDYSLNDIRTFLVRGERIGGVPYWSILLETKDGERKKIASSKDTSTMRKLVETIATEYDIQTLGLRSSGEEVPWEQFKTRLEQFQAFRKAVPLETRLALGALTMALLYFMIPAPVKNDTPAFLKKRQQDISQQALPAD